MFSIEDILSENFSNYPEEVQEFMRRYNEILREQVINGLVSGMADKMLKDIDKSRENFINMLTDLLENGCKGFNKMSTQTLIGMYLERRSQEDFFNLIEKVNEEFED